MTEIATDVGIKKPSIYAHFRNKDELYLSLIPLMIEAELAHASEAFQGGSTLKKQILAYLQGIEGRFNASYRVQFWIRAFYTPPSHLHDVVVVPMNVFMDDFEGLLKRAFKRAPPALMSGQLSADSLAVACLGIIDSLQVDFFYGGAAKYKRRLKALWTVFELAAFAQSRDAGPGRLTRRPSASG